MIKYKEMLRLVRRTGELRDDRTGTGTFSVFAPPPMKFDLAAGFPVVTGKYTNFHAVKVETLWYLQGGDNVKTLHRHGVHIWDAWAGPDGGLGPVYGSQWRNWGGSGVDQLQMLVRALKEDPGSRRHILTAWNVADLDRMALPPCHLLAQFYVASGRLSCQLYQRSADLFLGVPFNIASYSLLTSMLAKHLGLEPGVFTHVLGDAHIYKDHVGQVDLYLDRPTFDLPRLALDYDPATPLDEVQPADIQLMNYEHGGRIKANVSV